MHQFHFFYTEVVEYKYLHLRSIASWRHGQSRYSMRTAFWDRDRGGAMWSGCVWALLRPQGCHTVEIHIGRVHRIVGLCSCLAVSLLSVLKK